MPLLVLTDRHTERLVQPSCGIASLCDGRLKVKSTRYGEGRGGGARFYYVMADKKIILSGIDNFSSTATEIDSNSNRR